MVRIVPLKYYWILFLTTRSLVIQENLTWRSQPVVQLIKTIRPIRKKSQYPNSNRSVRTEQKTFKPKTSFERFQQPIEQAYEMNIQSTITGTEIKRTK